MIGIPVLNRADLLRTCIEHVDVDEEIIIVNNSQDRQFRAELLAIESADDRVSLLHQQVNLGVAGSWNLFRRLCDEEWLTIGSNDCFLAPGSIKAGRTLAQNTDAGLLCLCAMNFFMWSKTCVLRVGLFDDSGGFYPAYFEDNDYYRRLSLAGVSHVNVEGVGGRHVGSQTIYSNPEYRRSNGFTFEKNREYYFKKWGGVPGDEQYALPFGDKPLGYWVDLGAENRRQRTWCGGAEKK